MYTYIHGCGVYAFVFVFFSFTYADSVLVEVGQYSWRVTFERGSLKVLVVVNHSSFTILLKFTS